MEFPTLVTKVLGKLSPASAMENDKVNTGCRLWYEKLQKKVQEKKDNAESLTIVDKGIEQLDQWYSLALLDLLYFFIVNYAQQLMNPGDDHQDDLPPTR